ncbi:hypothetical protein [Streptomyces sp. NPDC049949]|uniref:hypothetical protein n=1 Tax=Streptomyces sp. NPDC049949 TaxID=3154627 RepID=UPI003418D6A3
MVISYLIEPVAVGDRRPGGTVPGGVDIALVAALALGTYARAVRAGVQAHSAGLPGPGPILEETAPSGASPAVERERDLTHAQPQPRAPGPAAESFTSPR